MDEKGLVLLYAFGMPGYSYENNNLHAIRVALEIKETAKRDFRHRVGVGIASGQICCGLIGKADFSRCEYALAGDMVNLAARLAARADTEREGCVLCDQYTIEVRHPRLK
ncbi:hypothetical protein JKP88DRAFT_181672 [Tribonema minus]|uniref:Guanylate cyclase domain-containing protein n=1 Tax=Tribonema minus TaxID=303371 RepID=A0A835YYC7_9STRA|nr:hypothetical protein JKP88DRAFT_181672 [Tribonema minus]